MHARTHTVFIQVYMVSQVNNYCDNIELNKEVMCAELLWSPETHQTVNEACTPQTNRNQIIVINEIKKRARTHKMTKKNTNMLNKSGT